MAQETAPKEPTPDQVAENAIPENPRLRAMNEITEAWEKRADSEAGETVPTTDEDGNPISPELVEAARAANAAAEAAEKAAQQPSDAEPAAAPATAEAPAPGAAPEQPSPIDPNAEYEVVVDGKPLKVKGSKIFDTGMRAFAKESAADVRLELANRILAEAERRVKGAIPPGDVPAAPAPTETPAVDYKAIAKTIQMGTEEDAANALKSILELKSPATSTEQLLATLEGPITAKMRDELQFQNALTFVHSEYADLMSDPYMQRLFFTEERRRRAPREHGGEASSQSYQDLYKSIGEDLRKHFNRPKPTNPQPAANSPERVAAKANALQPPRTAAQRLDGAAPQKPETPLDVINQMRKGRHQQTLQ